ncbi:MAG TPA: 50S ribosomal protein L6 [Bacteroidia bacterium]|nr:50S ribosomal protein L6 [Bacteroidia bacterium]
MSRIGKQPITIPQGVTVSVNKGTVTVKGKQGELTQKVDTDITIKVQDNTVMLERPTEQKRHKATHGMYRSLISNMIKGVNEGFKIQQEVVGVGYKAAHKGQQLDLVVGYSHHIILELPKEIKLETKTEKGSNPMVILQSADKQLLGQVAAKIRSIRAPEPYKGKGIKFVGEQLRKKAGKTAATAAK